MTKRGSSAVTTLRVEVEGEGTSARCWCRKEGRKEERKEGMKEGRKEGGKK